jgi:glycosyltransferase involved in cell wall biosynthesis
MKGTAEMRILHGMRDIASQASYSAIGLRRCGHQVDTAWYVDSPYSAEQPTFYIETSRVGLAELLRSWLRMLGFFFRSLGRYDVFHIHFGLSLLPRNLDLPLLRLLRRRLVMEFHGSDIRQGPQWLSLNPYARYFPGYAERPWIAQQAQRYVRQATDIIIHDAELLPYVPAEARKLHIVPLRIDLERFPFRAEKPRRSRPLIAHIPSSTGINGTPYIEEVLERLSQQRDFDYTLIQGVSQDEARVLCRDADIVIDKMLLGTYGMLSIECLALGTPVVCYIREDLLADFPPELPVVRATLDTLEAVLTDLIDQPKWRLEAARRGRRYVENYHDCTRVAKLLEAIYAGQIEPMKPRQAFDYVRSVSLNGGLEPISRGTLQR